MKKAPSHHQTLKRVPKRVYTIMTTCLPPITTPFQACNVINDLLAQGANTDLLHHSSPHLPLLLNHLKSLLPHVQQEIPHPDPLFEKAFTTGTIVGESYATSRLMMARAQAPPPSPTTRFYPPVVHCTSPTLSQETTTNTTLHQEHQLLHVKHRTKERTHTIAPSSHPFVVLLPWGGSQRRQYWPVVDHYINTLHCDVIELNMPMVAVSQVRVELLFALYQYLADLLGGNTTCFLVHSFSMNGAWTNARLQLIDQHRNGSDMFARCRCIVNDSCPVGVRSPHIDPTERVQRLLGSSRAYMPGILGKVTYSNSKLANIYAIGVLTSICHDYFTANAPVLVSSESTAHQETILDMYDTALTDQMLATFPTTHGQVPLLLLYSDGDRLIPSDGIELAATMMERNGAVRVERHLFHQSPHCMHFRRHKEEYCAVLHRFFDRIGLVVVHKQGVLQAKL